MDENSAVLAPGLDAGGGGDRVVAVDDGADDARVRADLGVVHDDRAGDDGARSDMDAAAEDRADDPRILHGRALAEHAVLDLAREDAGGRALGGAREDRPARIVEVERGRD